MKNKPPTKKFNAITIILIVLLSIRLLGQILSSIRPLTTISLIISIAFFIFYLLALVGVILKQKWGSILALIVGIIDALAAFFMGGAMGVGAGVADLILIFLAYKEYKQISS
jgi:hypothetical protein